MNYWLVKQEPAAYSWDDFVRDKKTAWTGVRNFQARANLAAMKKGDQVFFYHSVTGKCIVGLAEVVKTAYPDSTADEEGWICVDLKSLKPLPEPVTLEKIKQTESLAQMALVRQSRLSVMPVTADQARLIQKLGGF
jgi:predicted RNA-binding protein with PUA-like domain